MKYMHRKLQRDGKLKQGFVKTVESYISARYARKVSDQELAQDKSHGGWYIPHHALVNPNKPGRVTVVFVCAAKYAGKSSDNHLYTEPDILNSLIGDLLRFGRDQVTLVADLEAMYPRVLVNRKDQRFRRFLWWDKGNPNSSVSTYCM